MGLKRKDLQARAAKRFTLSRNQVAAKEKIRLERLAKQDARVEREIAEAEEWARRNPPPKLPKATVIRISIPGLPANVIRVSRFTDGKILAGNRITTARQLGRQIGVLLDQFIP